MNSDERKIIGRRWSAIASTHGKVFNNEAWTMMLNAVDDLPFERVKNALDTWLMGPKARLFPMPIDLRDMVVPPVTDEDVAREAASRVIAAVSKFGWNNMTEAREWIGELGWIAVVRAGGWSYVCENLGRKELPHAIFQAQVRDVCGAQIKLAKAGRHDQPINLPLPEGQVSLPEAQGILKQIDSRRGVK